MLPYRPMPQRPIPSSPQYYGGGGYAPNPSFAEGAAAAEYERLLAKYLAYEKTRRDEFFNACMFGKGYQLDPE